MKINYWILFAIIAACALIATIIIEIEIEANEKKRKVKTTFADYLLIWGIVGIPFSGVLCWCISLIAGTVYYVENGNKYSNTDYLIWYTSPRGETHFVAPFCTYIDNNASEDVRIKQYGYGNRMHDEFPIYDYAPQTFSKMDEIPSVFFKAAPRSIWTKGSGGIRTVLDYVSHSNDEYYNLNYNGYDF